MKGHVFFKSAMKNYPSNRENNEVKLGFYWYL